MDNYFSKCLDLITNCTNGIGVVLNVTLADFPDNTDINKVVLLSSGGDSPYTPGGFFLHQYNTNGTDIKSKLHQITHISDLLRATVDVKRSRSNSPNWRHVHKMSKTSPSLYIKREDGTTSNAGLQMLL